MNEPLVLIEGVNKRYRLGEVEVTGLRNVNLTVDPGEMVVALGAHLLHERQVVNAANLEKISDAKF